ncbi:uncharacterized protein LOC116614809 [Nematostella vectensis]|uniref:uncharacterized protein LOC116614809 n=1 Tax=Nematostella vectensis TaxID=45351 RepID=UPI0020771013|nr:uncharacterized protein LOC116614809 [Nematostella vectensis]
MDPVVKLALKPLGFLAKKGRDKVVEMIKDGDVTDQKLCSLIRSGTSEMKSKLDAISMKEVGAMVSFFEAGIAILSPNEADEEAANKLPEEQMMEGLRSEHEYQISESKKRLDDARKKATEAFNNPALPLITRISAMIYRVMSIIISARLSNGIEQILPECQRCLKELHELDQVRANFATHLKGGAKSKVNVEERKGIIKAVCSVNYIIYQEYASNKDVMPRWRLIKPKGLSAIDPLREPLLNVDDFYLPWAFGQEKLIKPCHIAMTTEDEFIVADRTDNEVKVFGSAGEHKLSFEVIVKKQAETGSWNILDLDTNDSGHIYTLIGSSSLGVNSHPSHPGFDNGDGCKEYECMVLAFDSKGSNIRQEGEPLIDLRNNNFYYITVTQENIFLSDFKDVNVYDMQGTLLSKSDMKKTRKSEQTIRGITAASTKSVFVLTSGGEVYDCNAEGKMNLYSVGMNKDLTPTGLVFHQGSKQLAISGFDGGWFNCFIDVYDKFGKLVCRHKLPMKLLSSMAVTSSGRLAMVKDEEEIFVW